MQGTKLAKPTSQLSTNPNLPKNLPKSALSTQQTPQSILNTASSHPNIQVITNLSVTGPSSGNAALSHPTSPATLQTSQTSQTMSKKENGIAQMYGVKPLHELKRECEKRNLPTTGTREELINRLVQSTPNVGHLSSNSFVLVHFHPSTFFSTSNSYQVYKPPKSTSILSLQTTSPFFQY